MNFTAESRARRRSTGRRSTSSCATASAASGSWARCNSTTTCPKRFELEYVGADNHTHRPVMIHRAPFGSMERFCGILIEHFAGAFPLWLAPEQARVVPISERFVDYGKKVEAELRAARLPRQRRLPAGKDRLQDPRSADGEDSVHAGGRREGAVGGNGCGARSGGRRPRGAAAGGSGAATDGGGAQSASGSRLHKPEAQAKGPVQTFACASGLCSRRRVHRSRSRRPSASMRSWHSFRATA